MLKKRTKKTDNPNTATRKEKKTPVQWGEYRHLHSWKMKPYCQETLEELADHMMTWALLEDSLRLTDFFGEHGLDDDVFYDELLPKSTKLKAAHKWTIARLASRREIGALTKKLDSATVFRSLANYCKIEREMMEFRANLAAKSKADAGLNETKLVVIERMPDSPLVPEKK